MLAGFVRVVTHARVFVEPSTHDPAFGFVRALMARSAARTLYTGRRHWAIFEDLCRRSGARGKLAADAHHAALAIEHGCVLVTADGDYARFPGLRWEHPLGG